MATTEIPPVRSGNLQATDREAVPATVLRLQDDLARSRHREALWMSLVFHLTVVLILATSPKWGSFSKPVPVRSAADLIRDRQLTFLDLPKDQQKVDKPPDTDRVSDKNRIATRRPTLDRKTLDELRDSARPGAPGPPAPNAAPAPPPPGGQVAQAQPPAGSTALAAPTPPPTQSQARLQTPPLAGRAGFGAALTPGEAIQQAARAAAAGRVGGAAYGGGAGGDYGLGTGGAQGRVSSEMDILSDTMGVDFGPYLSRVLHDVRMNWYNLIPEVARAPLRKKGKVSIEFAILKNGQVAGMQVTGPSEDVSLVRAAWGGIKASDPFPPLPGEFRGTYLALRFHFYYNPDKNDLQ